MLIGSFSTSLLWIQAQEATVFLHCCSPSLRTVMGLSRSSIKIYWVNAQVTTPTIHMNINAGLNHLGHKHKVFWSQKVNDILRGRPAENYPWNLRHRGGRWKGKRGAGTPSLGDGQGRSAGTDASRLQLVKWIKASKKVLPKWAMLGIPSSPPAPTSHLPLPAMGYQECPSRMLISQTRTQSCVPQAGISHFCHWSLQPAWGHAASNNLLTYSASLPPSLLCAPYKEGAKGETEVKLPAESLNCAFLVPSIPFLGWNSFTEIKIFEILWKLQ